MRDLLLISVGNTRTRCAIAAAGELQPSVYLPNEELATLPERLRASADAASDDLRAVIASVNDPVAARVEEILEGADLPVTGAALRMGRDLPIPVEHTLPEPVTVGQDRLLNALGAFSRSQQACIVIDAGTAVTVDFVDGHGVFQGGAIAPGVRMMLRAMHEYTAALPEVALSPANLPPREPEEGKSPVAPWGKTTPSAMTLGAVAAVRGLAHELIDRYAAYYEAYPRVVATGGDAPLVFDGDTLVEHVVPDLTLIGMLAACRIALEADTDEDGM